MKKWYVGLIVITVLFAMMYALVYFLVIPNAAEASLPYKWRNVLPGLKRNEYAVYLGAPVKNNAFPKMNSDQWIVRNGNYTFSLGLYYDAENIADSVTLNYSFSNTLFHKAGSLQKNKEE
ncbi:MAG: hypothetical protein ABI861_14210 [Panacibacter sp.]